LCPDKGRTPPLRQGRRGRHLSRRAEWCRCGAAKPVIVTRRSRSPPLLLADEGDGLLPHASGGGAASLFRSRCLGRWCVEAMGNGFPDLCFHDCFLPPHPPLGPRRLPRRYDGVRIYTPYAPLPPNVLHHRRTPRVLRLPRPDGGHLYSYLEMDCPPCGRLVRRRRRRQRGPRHPYLPVRGRPGGLLTGYA